MEVEDVFTATEDVVVATLEVLMTSTGRDVEVARCEVVDVVHGLDALFEAAVEMNAPILCIGSNFDNL